MPDRSILIDFLQTCRIRIFTIHDIVTGFRIDSGKTLIQGHIATQILILLGTCIRSIIYFIGIQNVITITPVELYTKVDAFIVRIDIETTGMFRHGITNDGTVIRSDFIRTIIRQFL